MKERLFSYLKSEKKLIVISFLSVLVFLICQLSLPLLYGLAINSIGQVIDGSFVLNLDVRMIALYLILAFVLSLIGSVFDYVFEYSIGVMTQRVVEKVRNDVFEKMLSVPIKTIDERKKGDLLQLEIQDIENLANGIFSVFKQLVQGVLSILITIIMMFTVNWILALAVIVLSPLSIFVSKFVATFSHRHFKSQSQLMGDLTAHSLESISNLEVVQSLENEENMVALFKEKDEKLRKEGKIAQFASSWTNPSTRLVNNTIYCLIGMAGIIMIIYTSSNPILAMDMGKLTSFLSYTNEFTKPFNEISSVAAEFETARFSFQRISEFLDGEDDIDDGKKEIESKIEEISFEDVFFSYEKDRPLITNFSEKIKRGEKIAIVGPTGSGKTTIINLLMRFYDIDKGNIRIDGTDTRDISKKALRRNFGMVLQDTWIFNGTVMENVRYARPDASDEEVIQACKESHADTFIQTLPRGYETVVSSKEGLSEGERQLLTISRVMLLKPDIVILDEATSNVDTRTEKLVLDAFNKVLEGKTSIVIAHRLSTIMNADRILVLKDGNVIESGNHEMLMKKGGFYKELYSSQFR